MQTGRRQFLSGAACGLVLTASGASAELGVLTPEQFGAKGDGISNDTLAFERLSAAISAQGGGKIVLRRATYIVGRQMRGYSERTGYSFEPGKILEFVGLPHDLVIRGNGAKIRCARGLRYGTFDAVTGIKTANKMPYLRGGVRMPLPIGQ